MILNFTRVGSCKIYNRAQLPISGISVFGNAALDSRLSDLAPPTLHTWMDLVWFLYWGHPKGSQCLSKINLEVAPFL